MSLISRYSQHRSVSPSRAFLNDNLRFGFQNSAQSRVSQS